MRFTLLLIAMLSLAISAFANEAAPYSAEANERIVRIQRKMEAPDIRSPDRQKNLANYLDHLNKLYKRADYDFPKSLAEYYQDVAERNGIPDERAAVLVMAKTVATLQSLMAGMPAENAFPGNEYEVVRLAYKRMRSVEQGFKLPDEEFVLAKKRKADTEKAKEEKLQEANKKGLLGLVFILGFALIVAALVAFLLSPVSMFFRRKKLAAKERAAPYAYIKKYGHYPEMQDMDDK